MFTIFYQGYHALDCEEKIGFQSLWQRIVRITEHIEIDMASCSRNPKELKQIVQKTRHEKDAEIDESLKLLHNIPEDDKTDTG